MDQDKGIQRFGDYLKSLRHDRRLTLERIEALSKHWPAPVSKTWLSRCEHAQTEPTFGRIATLARIYRVRVGEIAERYEIEMALARSGSRYRKGARAAGTHDTEADPLDAEEPSRALVLLEAAREAEGTVPGAGESGCEGLPEVRAAEPEAPAPEPSAPAASLPVPADGAEVGPAAVAPSRAGRLSEARSRLCLAVLSGSTGNYRICREEAEALFGAADLPEEIRLRAAVQLAFAWRKLRRAPLARLLLADLLARGEALPPRIQGDAHLLLGCLDLDDGASRQALLHLRKASALYREHGSPAELARSLQELGEAYRLSGRIADAMMRYQEGLAIARASGLRPLVSDLESHTGRAHFLLGQHAMAARILRESNEAARRTDAWDVLFRNAWYLRALAARAGDEFSRRTCERSLRQLLARTDPFSEEALDYRREVARKQALRQTGEDERDAEEQGCESGGIAPGGCADPPHEPPSESHPLRMHQATASESRAEGRPDRPSSGDGVPSSTGTLNPPAPPARYRRLGVPPRIGAPGGEVVPLSRKRNREDGIVRGTAASESPSGQK